MPGTPPSTPSALSPREQRIEAFIEHFVGRETAPKGALHHVDAVTGTLTPVAGAAALPPCPRPGCCRLLVVSDTHERHDLLDLAGLGSARAGVDVLVHCGDILMLNRGFSSETSLRKLRGFAAWLDAQPFPEKLVIGGNHDACLYALGKRRVRAALGCNINQHIHYLENDRVNLACGLRVFGSPASIANSTTSANKAFQYNDSDLAKIFCTAAAATTVPGEGGSNTNERGQVDVLLTHGPVDTLGPAARDFVEQGGIQLCVSGHVHEEHGAKVLPWGGHGGRHPVSVNAVTMGPSFSPTNPPVVIDVPLRRRATVAAARI